MVTKEVIGVTVYIGPCSRSERRLCWVAVSSSSSSDNGRVTERCGCRSQTGRTCDGKRADPTRSVHATNLICAQRRQLAASTAQFPFGWTTAPVASASRPTAALLHQTTVLARTGFLVRAYVTCLNRPKTALDRQSTPFGPATPSSGYPSDRVQCPATLTHVLSLVVIQYLPLLFQLPIPTGINGFRLAASSASEVHRALHARCAHTRPKNSEEDDCIDRQRH